MMSRKRIYDIFETCIQELKAGASVDDILTPYPQFSNELHPLLVTIQATRDYAANIRVPRGAQELNRAHLLIAARERINQKTGFLDFLALPRLVFVLAVLLVVFAMGSVTTATASNNALPGDFLYPIKLATERTRLLLTNDPAQRLELQETFDQKRVEEIRELYRKTNAVEVSFGGAISQMSPEEWLVQDIRVHITQDTQVTQTLEKGLYVDIKGVLQADGEVKAESIQVRQIEVKGTLQKLPTDRWAIDDILLQFTTDTKVKGSLAPGRQAEVKAYQMADGSLQIIEIQIKGKPEGKKEAESTVPSRLQVTASPAAVEIEQNEQTEESQATETRESNRQNTKDPKETEPADADESEKIDEPTSTPEPGNPSYPGEPPSP